MPINFLSWMNWRAVQGISDEGLLYILIFSAFIYLLIQGIGYLQKKRNSGKEK